MRHKYETDILLRLRVFTVRRCVEHRWCHFFTVLAFFFLLICAPKSKPVERLHRNGKQSAGHGNPFEDATRKLDPLHECGASLRINPACVRVLRGARWERAGLGHQLSEMVFFIHLSALHGAAFAIEPFRRKRSDHKVSHEFVNDVLGLHRLFTDKEFNELEVQSMANIGTDACGVLLEGGFLDCPGGDCFKSPVMMGAFRKYTPCLQRLSQFYGMWPTLNPFRPSLQTLNVVWHVRVGDRSPHLSDDVFFRNLFDTLYYHTSSVGKQCHHHVLGEWSRIDSELREKYTAMFKDFLRGQPLRILNLDLKNTLLYMLHADLLVGSGSSLSEIVPLFSRKPLYVNVQPKHGWNFLAESQDDALNTNSSGFIVTPVTQFRKLLEAKALHAQGSILV